MTHSYNVKGMTCDSCVRTVKNALQKIPAVISVGIDLDAGKAEIEMKKHISIQDLQSALAPFEQFKISEDTGDYSHSMMAEENKSLIETYKPLIIIFIFITGISLLTSATNSVFDLHKFMNNFMAGFFLTFSFFKLLDLKGFAESYSTYDLLAKKINVYGYIYPFIELALGIAYLTSFNLFMTNLTTVIVMGFSSIGVIQSVLDKRKIKCACLGSIFNLPMSTITIIEDLLMVAMALMGLISLS